MADLRDSLFLASGGWSVGWGVDTVSVYVAGVFFFNRQGMLHSPAWVFAALDWWC